MSATESRCLMSCALLLALLIAEPALPSEGIAHVLVNGVFVVRDGAPQHGRHPGQPVRRAPSF